MNIYLSLGTCFGSLTRQVLRKFPNASTALPVSALRPMPLKSWTRLRLPFSVMTMWCLSMTIGEMLFAILGVVLIAYCFHLVYRGFQ